MHDTPRTMSHETDRPASRANNHCPARTMSHETERPASRANNHRGHLRSLTGIRGAAAVITASITALAALTGCSSADDPSMATGVQQGPYDVVRVVDGDTIRVMRGGEEIVVRLIGINTPETVAPNRPVECYGPEASARAKELLDGKQVWLEYDPVSGMTDKYERTLAYVWLSSDVMLNELLVREGYAEEYPYSKGAKFEDEMAAAEREAQAANAGLWGAC